MKRFNKDQRNVDGGSVHTQYGFARTVHDCAPTRCSTINRLCLSMLCYRRASGTHEGRRASGRPASEHGAEARAILRRIDIAAPVALPVHVHTYVYTYTRMYTSTRRRTLYKNSVTAM